MLDFSTYLSSEYFNPSNLWLFCYVAFSIFATFSIIMENRESTSTLAWVLLFWFLPGVGIFLYLLAGRNWRVRSTKKIRKSKHISRKLEKTFQTLIEKENTIKKKITNNNIITKTKQKRILGLLEKNSNSILTENNQLLVLKNGEEKFRHLLQDIKRANKFIHMEYFIWQADELTEQITAQLIAKAEQGVEVKIILDPVGWFLFSPNPLAKRKMLKKMRQSGIKVIFFLNKLSPLKFTTFNYPLHRKVVIIDGKIGYTGGMNMGKEYQSGTKKFKSWKDTHLRIEGESTLILQALFAQNWSQTTGEDKLFGDQYFPQIEPVAEQQKKLISLITSGPNSTWDSIRQLFFSLINQAKKSVYIQTPYFVPDAGMFEAMKVTALSGVDIRLMITGVPDKKIPYWTAYTYFEELLLAGVKIYHYKKGFLHAKTIAIDSTICTIGSTNLDIRSFQTAYEINALIFDKKTTLQLENDFLNSIKDCQEMTLKRYHCLNKLAKMRNSLARLTAPLL